VSPANGFNQAVQLGCTDLPYEAACTFAEGMIAPGGGSTTLQLSTIAPHACGSDMPYERASLPLAGPVLAGLLMLFVPKRRPALKSLLVAVIALYSMTAMMGCGNCTDLGTRPGTYIIKVTGMSTGAGQVVEYQKVRITVTE
jgi:hypothetical protein